MIRVVVSSLVRRFTARVVSTVPGQRRRCSRRQWHRQRRETVLPIALRVARLVVPRDRRSGREALRNPFEHHRHLARLPDVGNQWGLEPDGILQRLVRRLCRRVDPVRPEVPLCVGADGKRFVAVLDRAAISYQFPLLVQVHNQSDVVTLTFHPGMAIHVRSQTARTWEPFFTNRTLMHLGPFARRVRLLEGDTTPAFLPIGRPWRRGWTALSRVGIWFSGTMLSLLFRHCNANHVLTIVGAIFGRTRRAELSFPPRIEEERVRAEVVARDRGVAAVRGDIARVRGRLLARQRMRAL